jgi:hypothetical protein
MTADLVPEDVRLVRHALGLENSKRSYRRYYAAASGSDSHKRWCDLEARGLAVRHDLLHSADPTFIVSPGLAMAVLRPGESLSATDFPTLTYSQRQG